VAEAGLATALASVPKAAALALDTGWCVVTLKHELACGALCDVKSSGPVHVGKIEQVAGRCARLAGGTVSCWDGKALAAIKDVAGATAIAATATRTCALLAGGTVTCWGATHIAAPIAL
jgi:hypothetical protein